MPVQLTSTVVRALVLVLLCQQQVAQQVQECWLVACVPYRQLALCPLQDLRELVLQPVLLHRRCELRRPLNALVGQ